MWAVPAKSFGSEFRAKVHTFHYGSDVISYFQLGISTYLSIYVQTTNSTQHEGGIMDLKFVCMPKIHILKSRPHPCGLDPIGLYMCVCSAPMGLGKKQKLKQ